MPMGYGANYEQTISEEDFKKICPVEYLAFENMLTRLDLCFDEFARCIAFDDLEDVSQEMIDEYDQLIFSFLEKTKLHIELNYHDSDNNGSCYDDVNGGYWHLNDATDFTLDAKSMMKQYEVEIQSISFVTFG